MVGRKSAQWFQLAHSRATMWNLPSLHPIQNFKNKKKSGVSLISKSFMRSLAMIWLEKILLLIFCHVTSNSANPTNQATRRWESPRISSFSFSGKCISKYNGRKWRLTVLVFCDMIRASFNNFPIMVWLSIDHHDSNIETRCRSWEICNK